MDGGDYETNDRDTQAYRCRQHAIRRARERFGVDLTHEDLKATEKAMRRGEFPFVKVDRDGVQFACELGGKPCRAVYNAELGCVVTVLTPRLDGVGNPAGRVIRRNEPQGPLAAGVRGSRRA